MQEGMGYSEGVVIEVATCFVKLSIPSYWRRGNSKW